MGWEIGSSTDNERLKNFLGDGNMMYDILVSKNRLHAAKTEIVKK